MMFGLFNRKSVAEISGVIELDREGDYYVAKHPAELFGFPVDGQFEYSCRDALVGGLSRDIGYALGSSRDLKIVVRDGFLGDEEIKREHNFRVLQARFDEARKECVLPNIEFSRAA